MKSEKIKEFLLISMEIKRIQKILKMAANLLKNIKMSELLFFFLFIKINLECKIFAIDMNQSYSFFFIKNNIQGKLVPKR